jgi:hypothetical protein
VTRTTRAFENPLSDAGVTFEGFESIKIPSREVVREKLQDFLNYCTDAKKPAIRVILGEWGEGKTDAYRRYLLPQCRKQGNIALFASASTLANSYRDPKVLALSGTTNLEAVRFLIALFNAAREEERHTDIQEPEEFKSAERYVNETLSALSKRQRRIIIFVDEFEELLLHQDILRQIISGIKEMINGYPKVIDQGGKFGGCLHLIVAATPDAFYRLAVSEETSLVFGGLGRRAGVIDLPQIRKTEAMGFLFSLLLHAYDGKLPDPCPIEDAGILETFVRISQGNPGNMVSLFTRMLNSARERSNPKRMNVVDHEILLRFLEDENIFIYGGETPCIERETYSRILKLLGEHSQPDIGRQTSELFRTLIAESRPFSGSELSRRLHTTESQAKNFVNIINTELRSRERIEGAILKVSRLKKEKSFADISKAFTEYVEVEREKKMIRIDNYSESIEQFEDRMTYYELNGGKIVPAMFLPSDHASVGLFFEGIGRDKSVEIGNMMGRHLVEEEDYYLASDELLSQIYPTPVPRELEFVRDRDIRLRLWREVTKSLVEQYEQHMPRALVDLIQRSQVAEFSGIKSLGPKREFHKMKFKDLEITTLVAAVNGEVKSTDIEEISRWVKSNTPPTHCCLITYTGEMTSEAEEKIDNKELGKDGDNLILGVRTHPTLAKRIISVYRALTDLPEKDLDQHMLASVVSRIVSQEIDFSNTIQGWLTEQENRGTVIGALKIESTSNMRELADSLKFFVNFFETQTTPDEIYKKNQEELLGFVRYNSRLGLIPDIEPPKFVRLVADLCANGFLKRGDRNVYSVKEHPVELRILKVLSRFQRLSEAELEQHFIVSGPKFLRDVYLPILEYKGRIFRTGHSVQLSNSQELYTEVETEFDSFGRSSAKDSVESFGFAYQWKKKGENRYISLGKFQLYVKGLRKHVKDQLKGREELALQKLSLLKRLLRYFQEEFIPLFEKAGQSAKNDTEEAHTKLQNFEDEIKDTMSKSRDWLKLHFSMNDLSEYAQASKLSDEISSYFRASQSQVDTLVGDLTDEEQKKFYFDKNEAEVWYFNPKLYQVSIRVEALRKLVDHNLPLVKGINDKFAELDQKQKSIAGEMPETPIVPYKVSSAVWSEINSFSKDIVRNIEPEKLKSTSLDNIKSHVDRNYSIILNGLGQLEKAVAGLVELKEAEKSLITNLEQAASLEKHCANLFDHESLKDLVVQLSSEISASNRAYQALSKLGQFETPDTLVEAISGLEEDMKEIYKAVQGQVSNVNEGWDRLAAAVTKTLETVESALKILGKKRGLETSALRSEITRLREQIGNKSIMDLELTISAILERRDGVLEKFYDSVRSILERKEAQVFNAVIEQSRQGRKSWLLQDELYEIGSQMKISSEETNAILRKLANLQLITIGVSIPY